MACFQIGLMSRLEVIVFVTDFDPHIIHILRVNSHGNFSNIILDQTERNDLQNIESNELAQIPYPKRVYLVLGTEFCERFTYFGLSSKFMFFASNVSFVD